jgi:hypothetical protein
MELWRKLNYLVNEPKCRIKGNQITEWSDARPRPTDAQINAVTDAQVITGEIDAEADREVSGVLRKDKMLFQVSFDVENRIRVLEGKPAVTKQQYKDALINIYKTL